MWLKRENINRIVNGTKQRRTNDEIYGTDPRLVLHQAFNRTLLFTCRPKHLFIFGAHVRKWFQKDITEGGVIEFPDGTLVSWDIPFRAPN
jgi:hypothetical protein